MNLIEARKNLKHFVQRLHPYKQFYQQPTKKTKTREIHRQRTKPVAKATLSLI